MGFGRPVVACSTIEAPLPTATFAALAAGSNMLIRALMGSLERAHAR